MQLYDFGNPKGGHGPMVPPKYAPGSRFRLTTKGKYPGHGYLGLTAHNARTWYWGDTISYYQDNPEPNTWWTADQLLIKTSYTSFFIAK